MSHHLCTIRNIAAGRRMLDLDLFDDGLLVSEASLRGMVGHMAGQTIRTFTGGDAPAGESAPGGTDPAAFAATNPSTQWIPWTSTRQVRLSRNWIGVSKLELTGADGAIHKFEWKKLQNDPAMVDDLLDRAVPASIRAR